MANHKKPVLKQPLSPERFDKFLRVFVKEIVQRAGIRDIEAVISVALRAISEELAINPDGLESYISHIIVEVVRDLHRTPFHKDVDD